MGFRDMSETRQDAVELADDLARKTEKAVREAVRDTVKDLDFDSEPISFLVALDDLADDPQ